jgi:uncharacterized protein YdaU (DUF1376 family)
MAELHYFSFYAPDWLSSPSVNGMLPEQEGAFIRLLATAWGNGDAEPSLPADDATLASQSRLGSRWKKLGPAIRKQFTLRDGRLYNAKLSEVWREGQKRHADAVARGKRGAAKRWRDYGRSIDQPIDEPVDGAIAGNVDSGWQSDPKETLEAPTEPSSSLSPSPLGAVAPRSGERRQMDETGTRGKPENLRALLEVHAPNLRRRPA